MGVGGVEASRENQDIKICLVRFGRGDLRLET